MWFHNCQISVLPAHVLFGKVPPLINSYTQEHPFSGKPARIPLKQSWHPWAQEQQNSAQQKSWSSTMICWPHFLTPPHPLYSDSSSVSTRALGGWTPGRGDQRGDTRHRGTDWWKRILNWKLEGRAETPVCSRTVLWSLCRGRQKAAACVTHQPGSSCQAPAPSLGFKLVPSLQLWGGKYKIFKHLLTYWTDVASRPFPKPCKVCLLLFLEHTFHN